MAYHQYFRWMDDIPMIPLSHRRSQFDGFSYNQDDVLSEREAILRVGFITSPSVSTSPVSQRGMQYWKELPLRPSVSSGLASPRRMIDKKLPPIPRRPVGRSRSLESSAEMLPSLRRIKTTNDLEAKDHVWSLFPKPTQSQSIDLGRPVKPGPHKWSFEASPVVKEAKLPETSMQKATFEEMKVKPRELMEAENPSPLPPPPPKQEVDPSQRHLRIKKSFARLTNLSKRPDGIGHGRNFSDGSGRIRSLFRRPSKLLRGGENGAPTLEPGPPKSTPIQSIPVSKPKAIDEQPPLSPVGIYDPVTRMWLIPQKSPTRTQFGVFDPESRTWMAPSPRTDSLRGVVAADANTTVGSNQRASTASDVSYENEEGALSLAEKLEIIRYRPLRQTISSPATSIEPLSKEAMHSLERTETQDTSSTFQTLQLQDRPRPWKPGQILGLKGPPKENGLDGTPLDDDGLENLNFTPPFAMHGNNSNDGSGYMSFESEQVTRAPWKALMKNVPHMLRRSSNLRHG